MLSVQWMIAATVFSYGLGALIGLAWLVPLLNAAAGYPWMIAALRRGRVKTAILRMLVWAAVLGACATVMGVAWPLHAERLILHGDAYRREMFGFVLTGQGAEGDPRQFLPQHAGHAALFCVLAIATGSALAMPLGAVLMNYMGFYVGALAAASTHPWRAVALAWVPWSLIRVASFVVLGVVLGAPLLSRVFRFSYRLRDERPWLALASAGLVADALLKWLLAPSWRLLIRSATGW
jgi:hypothetical protein